LTEDSVARLEHILEEMSGPGRDQATAGLSVSERSELLESIRVDDLVRESATVAPPFELDPVAALLGLVPDPEVHLDGTKFAKRCRARGKKPNAMAARLQEQGWRTSAADVFRWQKGNTSDVHPALIKTIAEILDTTPPELTSATASGAERVVAQAMESPVFAELAERFARAQAQTLDVARSALRARMLAVAHRGDEAEAEQMLASLEVLVATLEAK